MNLKKTIETEYKTVDSSLTKEIPIKEEEHFLTDYLREWNTNELSPYISAQKILKKITYTKEDITSFSVYLSHLENEIDLSFVGIFFSVLINEHFKKIKNQIATKLRGIDTKGTINNSLPYKIITSHLETEIDNLGNRNNGAHVEIIGDAGYNLGANMQDGEIVVYGNCLSPVGFFMHHGKITVKKAGDEFGKGLQGGTLFAEETGILCGEKMQKGTIHIAEEYNFGKHGMLLAAGGEIYFNNKKMYP